MEDEANRRKLEEEAKKKKLEEEANKKRIEEEAANKRKLEEEAANKRKLEEEAKKKKLEEEEKKRAAATKVSGKPVNQQKPMSPFDDLEDELDSGYKNQKGGSKDLMSDQYEGEIKLEIGKILIFSFFFFTVRFLKRLRSGLHKENFKSKNLF
jgi:hypothetical protein